MRRVIENFFPERRRYFCLEQREIFIQHENFILRFKKFVKFGHLRGEINFPKIFDCQ